MKFKDLLASVKLLSLVVVVMVNCAPQTPRVDGQVSRPISQDISQHDETLQCGIKAPSASPRVVGGEDAEPGEFPWHVGVYIKEGSDRKYNCGGVIIDRSYVVTAAHCVDDGDKVTIKVGSLNKTIAQSDTLIGVEKLWIYEIHWEGLHDIAILKTDIEIDFKLTDNRYGSVNRICLPSREPQEGEMVTQTVVCGWGCTSRFAEPECKKTEQLLKTNLQVIDADKCLEVPDNTYYPGDICVGSTHKSGVNRGDSGGPLVRLIPSGGAELAGIVSRGTSYDTFDPQIYTNVYSHLAWIESKMNESSGATF